MGREKNMYTDVFQCIPNRAQHKKNFKLSEARSESNTDRKKKIEPQ